MRIHNDIDQFISVKPALYRFLKAISFIRNVSRDGCTGYDIEIILSKISDDRVDDLKMRCINAIDIKIGEIESMSGMLVNIENISEYQLEGVSYRISEQENNTFSFGCTEFYADLIRP